MRRLVARKKVYDDMKLVLGEIARVQKALQVDPGTQFITMFFQWLSWHWAIHYILYCMVHLNKDMEALLLGVPLLGMMIDYVK